MPEPISWHRRYATVFCILILCASLYTMIRGIKAGPLQLDANLPGSSSLLSIFARLRLKLGDHVFPNVVVGKNGWLFFTASDSVDEYQRTIPFTGEELPTYQRRLDALNSKLASKGIKLIVVIAPNKDTIYGRYMPDQIPVVGADSGLDEFLHYMKKYGQTPIVDLRADLIKASKSEQVYYKADTHWNYYAEYIAYANTISALTRWYPDLKPYPMADLRGNPSSVLLTDDLSRSMGLPGVLDTRWVWSPKSNAGITEKEVTLDDSAIVKFSYNKNQDLPSALILHDSYFIGVDDLLRLNFRETTSIFRSVNLHVWSLDWVNVVHPDVVIIELSERYLRLMDLNIPPLPK